MILNRPSIHIRSLGLVAACLALEFLASPTWAQPISGHTDSLEWMEADSAAIVRGTIVALSTHETLKGGHPHDWLVVTFRVDETLKGEHRPTVEFVVLSIDSGRDEAVDESTMERWKEGSTPLLLFLHESRRLVARGYEEYARFELAPRTGYGERSLLALDAETGPQVFTLALRLLSQPEEMIDATRAAVESPREAGQLCFHWIELPPDLVLTGTPWAKYTGPVSLAVPIDARLEEQACAWIASEDGALRTKGAAALVYFKSDANAELLKGLLDDQHTRVHVAYERGAVAKRERVYEVRETAWRILKAWGVEMPQPIVREPVESDR